VPFTIKIRDSRHVVYAGSEPILPPFLTGKPHDPPPHALLHDIDRALDAAIAMRGGDSRDLLPQLVGIRRSLFADAPPFHPAPALGDAMAAGAPARKAA
jgi:hypothetical protein